MKRFSALFTKPRTDHRPWVMWTWNLDITRTIVEQQVNSIASMGAAGIVLAPGRDMKPAFLSDEFLRLFEAVLSAAHDKGMGVRLSCDMSMPWTVSLERELSRTRELRASRLVLEHSEKVTDRAHVTRAIANPADTIVVAAKLTDGKVTSLSDVKQVALTKGVLSWNAPAGEWQVMTLRRVWDTDATGQFVPNPYSTECGAAYANAVLKPIRERFPRYMSSTFKGIVLEMPHSMPREGSIPWDDDLVVKYRTRFKKELISLLPVVFGEAADALVKHRPHLYSYLQDSMYERFVASLDAWLRKHHLSQWVLTSERHPAAAPGTLRDLFALPTASIQAAGIQAQDGQDEDFAMVRAMASMNEVQCRRESVAIVGRSLQRTAPTTQSIRSELDLALSSGATHVVVDGFYACLDQRWSGKAGYGPFWYAQDCGSLTQVFAAAGVVRGCIDKLHTAPQVAVLVPGDSVLADYRPGADDSVKRSAALMRRAVRSLRESNVDFDLVSEELVLKSTVRQNGEFGTGERVRKGNYRVLVIPYARLISKSLLVFVEKMATRKGVVVFLDEAPQGELDSGTSRQFSDRIEKLLEQRKGFIRVVPARDLIAALDPVQSQVSALVNAAPCTDIQSRCFTGEGFDVYLIRNASQTQDYFATMTVPARKHVSIVECIHGEIHAHPHVETADDRSTFGLMFSPQQSHLVVVSAAKMPLSKVSKERKRSFSYSATQNRSYRMVLKNQWAFMPVSPNILPLSGWNMRIGLSRESGGYSHFYETSFFVNDVPQRAYLVLNGVSSAAQEFGGLEKCLEVTVNGTRLPLSAGAVMPGSTPDPLFSAFRDMLTCDLRGRLVSGPNRVIMRTMGLASHPLQVVYPPVIAGDFSAKKDSRGWVVDEPLQEIMHDSWTLHGFPHLSGVGEYRHVFEVPNKFEGLVLRFSSVSGSVSVTLNDTEVGVIGSQPMEFDITDHCSQKRNELRLRVTGTIDNFLRLNGRASGIMGEAYVDVY